MRYLTLSLFFQLCCHALTFYHHIWSYLPLTGPVAWHPSDGMGKNNNVISPGITEICTDGVGVDDDGARNNLRLMLQAQALDLDGFDDYVSIAGNDMLNASVLTLEAWVNLNDTIGNKTIISKFGDVVLDDSYILRVDNGHAHFQINIGTWKVVESKSVLSPYVWYHVAGVYDGTTMKIYINGQLENSSIQSGAIDASASSLKIGRPGLAIPVGQDMFAGELDEVRVWSVARTQAEIQSSKNCEITLSQTGLLCNYHFSQGVAGGDNSFPAINTLIDGSGNNNTGTLHNFSLIGPKSNWIDNLNIYSSIDCAIKRVYYSDEDADGYGNLLMDSIATSKPKGYVLDNTDCNDRNANIHPGALETCDGIDNNCNGLIDDGLDVSALSVSVSISSDDTDNTICSGATVTFTAAPVNAGISPSYQWQVNGSNVGPNKLAFTTSTLSDNDLITCIVTSNAGACSLVNYALSNSLSMKVIAAAATSVNVSSSDADNIVCIGSSVTFTAAPANGGPAPSFSWKLNGNDVGTNSLSYINNTLVNGDVVKCVMTSNAACIASPSVSSNNILINVPPAVSLGRDTSLCNSENFNLTAPGNFLSYMWNTGVSAKDIKITQPGTYWVKVDDHYGCVTSDTINIKEKICDFFIPNAFTPNNDGKNEVFKPILQGNIIRYNFLVYNRWGSKVFEANNVAKGWDGSFRGLRQTAGVYIWVCEYQLFGQPRVRRKGTVALIK